MPVTDQEYAKTLPFQPGMVISGKYRVERLIAAGGMGAVLLAHHEVLDQRVAIKLMRPEISENKEAAQRFLREARAAARIESDFVARVTDVDMWEGTPFMVMQYLNGGDLDDIIENDATVTVSDAVDYVMQGLAGLHAAHALGVIHRDLKPSNLFLVDRADGSHRVKILDFGISKVVGDESEGLKAGATTSTQAMLGTPRYMSPEQVSSAKDVDVRTDVWAMGLILYELLTKTYPFEGDSAGAILAAILTGEVPAARSLRRDVPKELDAVVSKMLAKKRDRRFPTAKSAMKALAPFASRRIQALLLTQDELQGAMADTSTHGTPSEVLSSTRDEVLAQMDEIGTAATAMSTAGLGRSEASTRMSGTSRSGPTDTSMSVAGVPKSGSGTTKLAVVALAVAGAIVAGFFVMNREPPASETAAAATGMPTVDTPVTSASAVAVGRHVGAATATPMSSAAPSSSGPESDAKTVPESSSQPTVAPVVKPPPMPVAPKPADQPKPKPGNLLDDWD